jgi:phosphatidylglycerophosphatase A
MKKYDSDSPSQQHPMTLSFAFSSPAHIAATFLGSGVCRPASGTWGTLAGLLVYMLMDNILSVWAWAVILLLTFIIGSWASGVTGKDIGVHDHSSIVIDEVLAIWMILMTVPHTFFWQVGAFLTFRFFDIVKIPPARWFDTSPSWQNGMGVMLDDVVAGIQSIILLQIIHLAV